MRSSTIILSIGLLAAPLSMFASPDGFALGSGTPSIIAVAALLQESVNGHPLEAAPVPTVGPRGVAPVDRVGGPGGLSSDAGPVNSTPFSDAPSGTLSGGGSQASQRDRTDSPADTVGVTPNVGR